jgi:hypothetical protein
MHRACGPPGGPAATGGCPPSAALSLAAWGQRSAGLTGGAVVLPLQRIGTGMALEVQRGHCFACLHGTSRQLLTTSTSIRMQSLPATKAFVIAGSHDSRPERTVQSAGTDDRRPRVGLGASRLCRTCGDASIRVSPGARPFSWGRTSICPMNRAGNAALSVTKGSGTAQILRS